MKLKEIILSSSLLLLTSCFGGVDPDYQNSGWIKARYHREIWSGYAGEDITRSRYNWEEYQKAVEEKNKIKLRTFAGDSLLLPDLDGNGMVRSGKTFQMK